MDVESSHHLERLRDQPEVKAALFLRQAEPTATAAWFERTPRHQGYRPPIEALAARFLGAGRAQEIHKTILVYGRPCWLLATMLDASTDAPFAIAVTSAEGAAADVLRELLRGVSWDYWHGSYFWK